MNVIAVLNQKGGAGKTTIATHLARALQLGGASVLLVDSDRQGSARDWGAVREDQPVPIIGIDRPTIERDLQGCGDPDFVVIDGAPQATELAISALKASPLVLVPIIPSPYDIWAACELVDLIKQRIELTDGALQARFVISRAIKKSRLDAEVDGALADFGLPVLGSRITQRVIYPTTAALGTTVLDFEPDGDAAFEILSLAVEVRDILAQALHPVALS
jgi:chromosome partitioning protein